MADHESLAIFSGIEALLVPETVGLKAEIVTVRSRRHPRCARPRVLRPRRGHRRHTAQHSDLIHGAPTSEILEKDATDFAEFRRLWAFRVLCDYLEMVRAMAGCSSSHVHTSLHFPLSRCKTTSGTLVAPSGHRPLDANRIGPDPSTEVGRCRLCG